MKKENNKKIYIIFACGMLGSFAIGCFIGGLFSKFSDALKSIDWTAVAKAIVIPANVLYVLITIVANVISLILYIRAKNKYQNISELDDDIFETEIERVEKTITTITVVQTIVWIFSYLLFPLIVCCNLKIEAAEDVVNGFWEWLPIVWFVVSLALYFSFSALTVGLVKKINPEKKGNVFDFSFKQKWISSMDEGELMAFAKGTRRAYAAGIKVSGMLWLISFISMFAFDTGILPIINVTVIMGVMMLIAEINAK